MWQNCCLSHKQFINLIYFVFIFIFLWFQLQDPEGLKFKWESLFEAYPYKTEYSHFMRISLAARDGNLQDWAGWVKSRIRGLLLKVLAGFMRYHFLTCSLDTEITFYSFIVKFFP